MATWPIDNRDAGVARPGRQVWFTERQGDCLDFGGKTVRVEFEGQKPFELPLAQAAAIGARAPPSNPSRWLPGSFIFDPDTGETLAPPPPAEPNGWTAICSDDGLPAISVASGIDLSGQQEFMFPPGCAFVVAGSPSALYGVQTELGVVHRWAPDFDNPAASVWVRAGKVGESSLPVWSNGLVGGEYVFVAPTDDGPEAHYCPALSGRRESDLAKGAPCIGGAAERAILAGEREFVVPAVQDGRLVIFRRPDEPKALWTAVPVEGIEGSPPGGALGAPAMDDGRNLFWVGATGVLIAPEDEPPRWQHWEPTFRSLRRARPFKENGVLWQLGQMDTPEGVTFAYRKLKAAASQTRTVSNPHFSGGTISYAAPDNVRRYSRPWGAADADDMLRLQSSEGFLAPLVTFAQDALRPPPVLAMHVEADQSGPFLQDETGGRPAAVCLRVHTPLQPLSERLARFDGVAALDDIVAVVFRRRLFVMHRNAPSTKLVRCVSWPLVS